MIEKGTIYFVGAGPGDPALLTVRAMELIRVADAVSYDCFVSREIIGLIPGDKEIISPPIGSKQTKRSVEEYMRPAVEAAGEGKVVVRLKSGDPWLFGRTDREVRYCADNKIRFEIIGGVTPAISCFAEKGIPLTEKGRCDVLEIRAATASDPIGKSRYDKGKTCVYLLHDVTPADLAGKLIENGWPKATPAYAANNCSYKKGRVVYSSLEEAPEKFAGIGGTIVMAVGHGLDEANRISRPRRRGAKSKVDTKMLDLLVRGIGEFDWLIPDGPEAAYASIASGKKQGVALAGRQELRIAAPDEVTAQILNEAGFEPAVMLNTTVAEELLAEIRRKGPLVGGRFLVPHVVERKPEWTRAITKAGGIVVGADAAVGSGKSAGKPAAVKTDKPEKKM